MTEPVLPVPCSLKQNERRCIVKKDAVTFWCAKGLYSPGQLYEALMGEGTSLNLRFFKTIDSSKSQFTKTSAISPSSDTTLLFGITVVILSGLRTFSSNARLSMICTLLSND